MHALPSYLRFFLFPQAPPLFLPGPPLLPLKPRLTLNRLPLTPRFYVYLLLLALLRLLPLLRLLGLLWLLLLLRLLRLAAADLLLRLLRLLLLPS